MFEGIETIYQNKMFIKKLLNMIVMKSFSKIENRQVVENLFPKIVIRDLLESHHFSKFGSKK